MHAFLITGRSSKDRIQKAETLCHQWAVLPFDIFRLQVQEEKHTIGIAEIRMLSQHLVLSPRQSPAVVAIIYSAHLLTQEAQHALLKTLEEPPAHVRIILEVDHESLLLPTIVSRCQIIPLGPPKHVSDEEKKKILHIIEAVGGKNPGEICHAVDQHSDSKEEKIQFLTTFLHVLHEELSSSQKEDSPARIFGKTTHIIRMIRAVLKAQNQLSANVNEKLVFDALFFKISLDKE